MNMKHAIACLTVIALFLVGAEPIRAADKHGKPNVLFVVLDDLNTRLGCYGDAQAKSPNIDRFADRGVRFERAYAQYPVCNPSRVSFLSGLRPERTGVFSNDSTDMPRKQLKDHVFLPQAFRQQGWFTARVGKVFHIGRDLPECWDVTEEGTGLTKPTSQPWEIRDLKLQPHIASEEKTERGLGESPWIVKLKADDDATVDGKCAERVCELLEKAANGDKPFFIAAGFRRPHLPWMAPQRYFDAIDPTHLTLPDPKAPPLPMGRMQPASPLTPEQIRRNLHAYYAVQHFSDEQVGKLWATMDRLKLWDNTIVVLLGDHGYFLGERSDFYGKGNLLETACRTPLIIAGPGVAKKGVCPRVVELLDLYPTLADLCGVKPPENLDGRSLRPLLEKPQTPWPHAAFTVQALKTGGIRARAVRTERWRYVEGVDAKVEPLLFDEQSDSREWKNLAANPDYADAVAKLKALLADLKVPKVSE
jgi:uncharacterized sulfatase